MTLRGEIGGLRADVFDAMRRQSLMLVGSMVTISGITVAAAGLI